MNYQFASSILYTMIGLYHYLLNFQSEELPIRQYTANWKEVQENLLSIFHEEGHAGLLFQCTHCANDQAAQIITSFYPTNNQLDKYNLLSMISSQSYIPHKLSNVAINNSTNTSTFLYPVNKVHNFTITEQAADNIFNRFLELAGNEDPNVEYDLFQYTCIHFVQEIYEIAGFTGDHYLVLHPEGYASDTLGTYKFLYDFMNHSTAHEQLELQVLSSSPIWDLY